MTETTYLRVGSGPIRVLALHGWFGSAGAWQALLPALDETRFTYVFMNYRGYGASKDRGGRFTIDEIAADGLDLADHLGWRDFNLLGHSMGGMAIQRILAEAPQRVRKLVAVTPVPASGVPFDDATWALFERAAADPAARRDIVAYSTGGRLTSAWVQRVVEHSLQHSSQAAFVAYLHAWAKTDFHARIAGNEVPILVVVGANDPSLTAEVMSQTFLRWYPNASLKVLDNTGHYPMDETPVALATAIEQFLAP